MSASPKHPLMPGAKPLARPAPEKRLYSIFERDNGHGYGDTQIGTVEATDAMTAEQRWAKGEGAPQHRKLSYLERREIRARLATTAEIAETGGAAVGTKEGE